ncbi:MAG: hypothetical protein N2490_00740 [Ignavibacteria bacterium]|nr:hypothetical protein [Ignavibacteria bacterium]
MKTLKFLFFILFIVGCSLFLISCGSKEKDKALKYIKELNEYIKSTELLNLSYNLVNTAIVKDANGEINFDNAKFVLEFNNALEKKKEEIAKKAGFKDFKEAESVLDKLKDEKEIKEQLDTYKNELKKIQGDLEKEGLKKVEDMRQQQENFKKEQEIKFDPETGEVYDDETVSGKKTVKDSQSEKKESKEVKKDTKEQQKDKKEIQTEKPKPNNNKVEHPEDNLP